MLISARQILLICFFFFSLSILPVEAANQNITTLLKNAKEGNVQAQLEYAKAIFSKSQKEAFDWAQKAANAGSAEAWFWMGNNTAGPESNKYYLKAAAMGYAQAFPAVIDALLFNGGDQKNLSQAKVVADLARQKKIAVGFDDKDSAEKLLVVDRCYASRLAVLPQTDLPSEEEKFMLRKEKDSDCHRYRYGLGVKQDWTIYRKCLLSQNNIDQVALAEIYANGWGVKRNPTLAIALICKSDGLAPAELIDMVNTLYATRLEPTLKKEFQFCEHITSGANMGICAAIEEKLTAAKRNEEVAVMTSKWTPEQLHSFQALQKAADNFFTTRSTSELDMSGTARGMIAISEVSTLQQDLVTAIKKFESGQLPSNVNLKNVDDELNTVYVKLMKANFQDSITGTITQEGIKNTQRKWLIYRDAWAAFGRIRYPSTTIEAWKVWVTSLRIKQLKELLADATV